MSMHYTDLSQRWRGESKAWYLTTSGCGCCSERELATPERLEEYIEGLEHELAKARRLVKGEEVEE